MTIPVATVLTRAAETLYDETNVEWALSTLEVHLNAAIAAIVEIHPAAFILSRPFQCTGGTKQELPAGATAVVDVVRNLGLDGGVPGRAVTVTPMAHMNEADPNWHAAASSAITKNAITDPRNPRVFYVHPPQPQVNPTQLEVVYQAVPDDITTGDDFPLPDVYENAAYYFTVGNALLRRSADAELSRAQFFIGMFIQAIGGDATALARFAPRPAH